MSTQTSSTNNDVGTMPTGSIGGKSPPFWMPHRAIFGFVAGWGFIYIDGVASNYALKRWTALSLEQKEALPDIVHDNFAYYENHLLKEFPTAFLWFIVSCCFMLPYDILGKPPSKHNPSYTRGECCVRFLETRMLIELMRACTVFATTMSDPHGLHCTEIETSEMENIWSTFTLARCGDNIFSGHAGMLVSMALCIQTYFLPMKFDRKSNSYRILSAALWLSVGFLNFYVVVSRMHYTVDVLLSCFLVPNVWFAWIGIMDTTKSRTTRTEKSTKVL